MPSSLNNVQQALLELFDAGVDEETLLEIKNLIAVHLLQKKRQAKQGSSEHIAYSNERLQMVLSNNLNTAKQKDIEDWLKKTAGSYRTGSRDLLEEVDEFFKNKRARKKSS